MGRSPQQKRLAVTVAAALFAVELMALGAGVDFPFDRVEGTYENVSVEALPMNNGPLDLKLSSTENTVTLKSGSLRLEPAEDRLHKALIRVSFMGEGQLVTELKLGAIPSHFEDQVRFPQQEHTITAWVMIEAEEEGYRVTTERLPETVRIEVESERAIGLVGLCRQLSVFIAGGVACEQLESMLSNPSIPLPKPGSHFLVRSSDLTEGERRRLDLYLAGSKL